MSVCKFLCICFRTCLCYVSIKIGRNKLDCVLYMGAFSAMTNTPHLLRLNLLSCIVKGGVARSPMYSYLPIILLLRLTRGTLCQLQVLKPSSDNEKLRPSSSKSK